MVNKKDCCTEFVRQSFFVWLILFSDSSPSQSSLTRCQLPQSGSLWQNGQLFGFAKASPFEERLPPLRGEDVVQRQKGECGHEQSEWTERARVFLFYSVFQNSVCSCTSDDIFASASRRPASSRSCCNFSQQASNSSCGLRMQSISPCHAAAFSCSTSAASSRVMGRFHPAEWVGAGKLSLGGKISRSISTPHALQAAFSSAL